ncbi:GNAT family N-acetyltransferase [Nonomuraea sediminis]|uniref:GNAT family N-acetyltransferase n=1 Tax=Nonomuraea sediminis TaxID=2835864 RepID=UPI001BDC8877|nr:GNAT family N-acetyltransferase [Nonomuraea sediminis]
MRTSTPSLQAAVVTDPGEWPRLQRDWDDLYARCATATPFQSHAWLGSWWQEYGRPGDLTTLLVRRADRLVAAVPLMRRRRWGCRVLAPIATAHSDYTDILLDESAGEQVLEAVADGLARLPGWDVIDFPEVRPGSAADLLHEWWAGRNWYVPASSCLIMAAMPLEEHVARIGGRAAGKLRRSLRKIEEMRVTATPVTADGVPAAVHELLRLHRLQWRGRGINKDHLKPQFRRHLIHSAKDLIPAGQAALTEFRVGGELVASNFSLVGKDFAGGYLYGADPRLRTSIDVFALVLGHCLRETTERGLATLSMLRGDEPHKAKWGAVVVDNHRLILGRTRRAALYAGAASGRVGAAAMAKHRFPSLAEAIRSRH